MAKGNLKCHRCAECNGMGCPGMLPGLGGVYEGKNFQSNYKAWKELFQKAENAGHADEINKISVTPQMLRCGPVTGAVENIGFDNEEDFYFPYLKNAFDAGFGLCVGDGCPDEKLKFGVAAVRRLGEVDHRVKPDDDIMTPDDDKNGVSFSGLTRESIKAAFFLKPYPQEKLFERIEWVKPYAEYIGIDIDSYNIVTMRNLVNLERKTALQLEDFRGKSGVPFVIKGVFTAADIELVREVRPEVVYISNHGGRVETELGSTGEFLEAHAAELKKYCKEIWVDGGIRCKQDIQTAVYYGADKVIIARPLIRGTFDDNYAETIKKFL